MNADEEIYRYDLPTEILLHIFGYLPGKDLVKCRQVNTRWKLIIDDLIDSETLWTNITQREFKEVYFAARDKASSLDCYDLYKSLTLWPRLNDAVEETEEFAAAQRYTEEVRSLEVLRMGVVMVHKKTVIEYYDVNTLKLSSRKPITGDYAGYAENDSIFVIKNYQLQLYVTRKYHTHDSEDRMKTFFHVRMFLLTDKELFFVNLDNEVHACDATSSDTITSAVIFRAEENDSVISLGYKDGCLSILTTHRNIYTVAKDRDTKFIKSITNEMNILHTLHEFNFLKALDWRVYFQWMFALNHSVPSGPMRDLIIIRPYGDVFFVGTNSGVLSIFYRPYINGELDLFHSEPLRCINFMECAGTPILSTCPILEINILEVEFGHTIFVAMPWKVAVLKYRHNFIKQAPNQWVSSPYELNYFE